MQPLGTVLSLLSRMPKTRPSSVEAQTGMSEGPSSRYYISCHDTTMEAPLIPNYPSAV